MFNEYEIDVYERVSNAKYGSSLCSREIVKLYHSLVRDKRWKHLIHKFLNSTLKYTLNIKLRLSQIVYTARNFLGCKITENFQAIKNS